jgi:hypothetical protein
MIHWRFGWRNKTYNRTNMTTQELNDRIAQREAASYIAVAKVTSLNELVLNYSNRKDDPETALLLLNIIYKSLTDDRAQIVIDYSNSVKNYLK